MASSSAESTVAAEPHSNLPEHENDDMGSLFEGMVLFTTPVHTDSNSISDDQNQGKRVSHDADAAAAAADSLSQLSSSSLPLDEDLFSDLSLIVAAPDDRPPSPLSSPSASSPAASHPQPHLSTRKKRRAAGLRIGYGRDRDGPQPPSRQQLPDPNHHSLQSKPPTFPVAYYHTSNTNVAVAAHQDGGHQIRVHLATQQHSPPHSAASTTCSREADIQQLEENEAKQHDEEEPVLSNHPTGSCQMVEFRFEEIKTCMTEKLKKAREAVSFLSAARKDSIRKRRKAALQWSQASAKYRELEKQLEEACETEDFEKAERVSESLAPAEKDRELLVVALRDAEAECDAFDSRMQEALQSQILAEEESASLLRSFALDASNGADLVLENAKAVSLRETEEWLLSTEELELKKLQLEIESQLINEARLALNNSIELSVEDDHRERDILYMKREILADELEKLLALVKEKEAEIAENNSKIETVERRIDGVFSNFEQVHSSLDEKHNNLELDLRQLDLEHELLTNKKKQIDDDLSQEEVRGEEIREISRISAIEASICQDVVGLRKSMLQLIQKFIEDKMKLSKTEQQFTEDVNMLKLGISSARASLQELSSSKSSIQQEVESCKQRLFFIDKRLPELEAEKKVAATTRNFKEAARIATEVKALSVERVGIGIKMGDAKSQLQQLEEQICNTVNRLEQTESQVLLREKELEMARFQRLTLIAEAATAERFAAIELGDLEEADVLLAEADAAASEARKLLLLRNFRDEDLSDLPKHFVPIELVSKLEGKQLAELMASIHSRGG
ncbi:paramyosin, long form isoform X1 [Coffea eugenioides]|uniref:paramyosin, long form isoform X1 n=1 Tax=Coffea eugenioides TaxID=49369 RepID=UPI000F6151BC|nr:paramyosin, long form isoform X1 [Coffea eugenioides]